MEPESRKSTKTLNNKILKSQKLARKNSEKGIVSGDLLWLKMILMNRAGVHDFPLDVDV